MGFQVIFTLVDSFNRKTHKNIETNATTLAEALTAVTGLAGELEPLTDLALEKVDIVSVSSAAAFAGQASSNVDTGATFRVQKSNGAYASHHIPGFPLSKVGAGGIIDVADADVAAYFALFETEGAWRLSDGEYITSVVYGQLDK